MNNETHNNQAITQYLLGSLPEAEAERLDELSFTDDEFAEALRTAEKDLVDAYVQGELTGAALKEFESQYLASPLRREKVEFARAFQVFAEKNAVTQGAAEGQMAKPDESETVRKGSEWFSALGMFTTPRLALQWGAAFAALALLIAGGWLVFESMRLRQQVSQMQARREVHGQREQELQKELEGQRSASAKTENEMARVRGELARLEGELRKEQKERAVKQAPSPGGVSIAFILAPQVRGVGQIQTVLIPAKTHYVSMQLQLEPNDYSVYRVVLINQSGSQTLWRSGKLKATTTGDSRTLSVSFRADLLRAQVYMLRVSGVSANGTSEIVSDYPFRVVKITAPPTWR